jgi:hypothetical protein
MKRISLVALALISVASVLVWRGSRFVQKPSVLSPCPDSILKSFKDASKNPSQTIHPSRVVIEPWEGRHNVYGIFVLPAGYQPNGFFALNVEGSPTYCGTITVLPYSFKGISTQPGERVAIGYLRTRTAMWLITKGKRDALQQPRNWVLQGGKQS